MPAEAARLPPALCELAIALATVTELTYGVDGVKPEDQRSHDQLRRLWNSRLLTSWQTCFRQAMRGGSQTWTEEELADAAEQRLAAKAAYRTCAAARPSTHTICAAAPREDGPAAM